MYRRVHLFISKYGSAIIRENYQHLNINSLIESISARMFFSFEIDVTFQ